MKRTDDAFGQRLREAAAAMKPATSEELHARVMADVRRERAIASSAAPGERAAVTWWWAFGSAAALVAAVSVTVWLTTSPPPAVTHGEPVAVAALPPLPAIETVVIETVEPMREKIHEARFAYLDRDAKRLARFLIHAVPGVPADANEGTHAH